MQINGNDDVDFVIPWVDGNDPQWIEEFNKWSTDAKRIEADSRAERYRDYGLLRYWFRGVEQYAPWVRKVHFITSGQRPEWLNLDCPKLNWVKHSDYIPSEYLPVFSSHPIELLINKIPNLSERFVYFNDDIFLTSTVTKEYFFKKGLPCDYGSFNIIGLGEGKLRIPHIQLNNMIEINKNFTKKEILRKNRNKWFTPTIGKEVLKNILYLPYESIASLSIRHFAQPYLKSTLEDVWRNCNDVLEQTMQHRFRNKYEDVNQWLFRFWQLCDGNFFPKNHKKQECMINISRWTSINTQYVINHKYAEICINDDTGENVCPDYIQKMNSIKEAFQEILPEKSSFEL